MPVTITHALSMTSPDDTNYENKPSDWNRTHAATMSVNATEISGLFSNANSVSFGLSAGSRITASINPPGATSLQASAISILSTGTAAGFKDLQRVHDLTRSAGHLDGGEITDAGGGNIDVATGRGFIRATSDDTSDLFTFDWPATAGIAIPTDTIRYVRVNYNAGTPDVTVSASEDYDYRTSFPLGFVINEGGTLYINQTPHNVGRIAGRVSRRNYEVDGRSRADALGGLIISEGGTAKTLVMTSGVTWLRGLRETIAAFTSTGADRFDRYYRAATPPNFTREAAQQFVPDGLYDDGSGTLQLISNNNYANYWFYLGPVGVPIMVYGRGNFLSLAAAQAEAPPPTLPLRLQVGSLLLGRMILRRTVTTTYTVVLVETAFGTAFASGQAADHGNLAGLADDDHPQYHLTNLGVIRGIAGSGASTVTNDTVQFDNANGITFGLNGSTITASHDGLTSQSNQNALAGNGNFNFQTISFSNANGVSFSTAAGSAIQASIGEGATATGNLGGIAGSAASTVTNGTVVFSNANAVSFGLAGSTMTASYTVPVQSNGILDVATATASGTATSRFAMHDHAHRGVRGINMQGTASTYFGDFQISAGNNMSLASGGNTTQGSVQLINLLSSGGGIQDITTATQAGTGASIFARHDHQHRGIRGINAIGTASTFFGDLALSGAGAITLGTGGNTTAGSIQISAPATSSLSAQTNITIGTTGNTIGFSVLDGAGNAIRGIAAGGSTASTNTVNFVDSNGVSFGFGGGVASTDLTASITTNAPATTVSSVSNVNVVGTRTSRFALEDHRHVGVGGVVPVATASTFVGNVRLSAGNNMSLASAGNSSAGTLQLINLLTSGGAIQDVATATSSGTDVSLYARADHAHRGVRGINAIGTASTFFGDLALSGAGAVVLATGGDTTAGSIQISVPAQTVQPVAASAAGGSVAFSTLSFSNLNGVSFVTAAGPAIQASVQGQAQGTTISGVTSGNVIGTRTTRFANEDHQHEGVYQAGVSNLGNTAGNTGVRPGRLVLQGGNNITLSQATAAGSLQTVIISAGAGGGGFSGGVSTGGNTLGSTGTVSNRIVFVGGPNITLSQSTNALGDSATITISAPNPGGAGVDRSWWNNAGLGAATSNLSGLATSNGTIWLFPLTPIDDEWERNMTANTVMFNMSASFTAVTTSTIAKTLSMYLGIYTILNSTRVDLINSVSVSVGGVGTSNQSASFHGPRFLTIHSSEWSSQPVFTAGGRYFGAFMVRTAGEALSGASVLGMYAQRTEQRSGTFGSSAAATNTTMGWGPWHGRFSVSSADLPVSFARANIAKNISNAYFIPNLIFNNEVSSF